jgi:arginyl-tRNA synthetase
MFLTTEYFKKEKSQIIANSVFSAKIHPMEPILRKGIQDALQTLGLPLVSFVIEHPKDLSHGDWASNVALVVSKQLGRSPSEVAQDIAQILRQAQDEFQISEIQIAGPGFINFTLSREVFVQDLALSEVEGWGKTHLYEGQKILVEHSSPNLFKPFHIGHLMNNTIGEAITRLAKHSGAEVTTMSFPSDISLGVAKAIFVLLEKYGEDFEPTDVSVLGDAYVEGTKRYEEDEATHVRIKEIADNLYEKKESPEWKVFQKCKSFNIAYFENIVARLGSHFDGYVYESEAGDEGKKIILENTPEVFTESEGALVYIPTEERKDINTAVFINSQGNPTYEAKDVGLLALKFEKYNPDQSIFITDGQQVSHFQVVLDAVKKIQPQWAEKSLHRYHGRMTFKGQKMSSRLGGVPLVEDVLSTVIDEVKEKNPDVSEKSAEQIALGALKYAILKSKVGMNIDFDPEASLSFEGSSGPYLQYTAVRAGSLLQKGAEQGITTSLDTPQLGTEILERVLVRFPEVVARAQIEWSPHYLVMYLTELAQYFNSWYGGVKIIDEDRSASAYRLTIVSSVRNTLVRGLHMLGIEVPERM